MYSYEIEQYLKERNYILDSESILPVIDLLVNTQIARIKYSSENNEYEIWTHDGYYFKFTVEQKENKERKRTR